MVMYPPLSNERKTFLQVDAHIEQLFAIIGTDQKLYPTESFARTRKEQTINSLGDNRSSKILFGKRKNLPLQFLRIRNLHSKLFERIFCRVKTKRKTPFKNPSTIRRKIQVLLMFFLEKIYKLFSRKKRFALQIGQTSFIVSD